MYTTSMLSTRLVARLSPSAAMLWLAVAFAAGFRSLAVGTPLFPQSVASGDPTPNSVIVWTRLTDLSLPTNAPDPTVRLEVASDPDFSQVVFAQSNLVARGAFDFCVKARVTGLAPRTRYYYRFLYALEHSPVGRTQTAPAAGDPVPVRFAFVSCQDYIGRYYNTWAELAAREADNLDFVIHLGDYIYETVNDASFQETAGARQIRFRDIAGAKNIGGTNSAVYAASSLDNYRQLYETYRSDAALQSVHERFPMINIWDDHEYANDCWGATSTDSAGKTNEYDPDRRRHAEQAFFEFIPIAIGFDSRGVNVDDSILYPNAKIYRNLSFGSLVDLFLTDYRSYRPNHLVPDDAFPATIVMPENVVSNLVGGAWPSARTNYDPYVNIDQPAYAVLKGQLVFGATLLFIQSGLNPIAASARASQTVQGNLSVTVINIALQQFGSPTPFTPGVIATLPRGLSYAFLGKQDFYSDLGSRYLLVRDLFQVYAKWVFANNPEAENAYGDDQLAYLTSTLGASKAPWKIVTSSVSFCPISFNFANPPFPLPANFPSQYRVDLQLNADDWDGFPEMRRSLMNLYGSNNAVVISGDIHSSFISTYPSANGHLVPEFTGPSVSSQTIREGLASTVSNTPSLSGIPDIATIIARSDLVAEDGIDKTGIANAIDVRTGAHGYVVMDINADRLVADYHLIASHEVTNDYTDPSMNQVLRSKFQTLRFAVTQSASGLSTRKIPALSISQDASGNLLLAWPANGSDCQLQSADSLSASAAWTNVSATPQPVIGAGFQVTLPPDASSKYYRLLCPTP